MDGDKKNVTVKFTKQQLLTSEKYADKVDLLNALLEDGGTYSISEVEAKVTKFMKGKVK